MTSRYRYSIVIENEVLGVSKQLKAASKWELENKVMQQRLKWGQQEERLNALKEKERQRQEVENMKIRAEIMDQEQQSEIEEYKNILSSSLSKATRLDWNAMLLKDKYAAFSYSKKKPTYEETLIQLRVPKKSFLEIIFKSKLNKRMAKEEEARKTYNDIVMNYEKMLKKAHDEYIRKLEDFENNQKKHNDDIMQWKENFESGDGIAIERYMSMVLSHSKYPGSFLLENEVFFDVISQTAVVSIKLPCLGDLPENSGYKYVATRKSIEPILMKEKEKTTLCDSVIHQIALRTIHELYTSVYVPDLLNCVVFNGWVSGVSKATGQDFEACILSVQVSKEDFSKLNLNRIDPRECLKSLKAIHSGSLHNLAPIKPIMEFNREDKRFVPSEEVMEVLDETTNLAAIPWDQFEHLVRELFEKYFSNSGCEVRVTQASRDGGVDAIAFDPDPIRGGKFVIQAKRYNNVVPVAACRDLYGTMISEGATKGILVTTSHYGQDTRDFVKDKPITIIDGSNLVHMFNEYGYNFRIKLKAQ